MRKKTGKFDIIRQRDAMQCGAACLCMVARHFGRNATLEGVEETSFQTKKSVRQQYRGIIV